MYKFIHQNPRLFMLSMCMLGLGAGHLTGRYASSTYTSQYLTPFESEDQVFHILDTTNKPVVVYYLRGMHGADKIVRRQMLKYSTLYHDRATWMIASYKQHAAHINNSIMRITNDFIPLVIRFPKTKFLEEVKEGEFEEGEIYTSSYFDGKGDPRQVKHFLEKYAVTEVNDGLQPLREVAQETLFGKIFTK